MSGMALGCELRTGAARATLLAGRMRELLELLAALRALEGPLTTPAGLRGALAVLERLAILLGAEDQWLDWLRRVTDDDALLAIVASIVDYMWRRGASQGREATVRQTSVEPLAWHDWLPLLLEMLELLSSLRGAQR